MGRINKVLIVVEAQRRAEQKYLLGAEYPKSVCTGLHSWAGGFNLRFITLCGEAYGVGRRNLTVWPRRGKQCSNAAKRTSMPTHAVAIDLSQPLDGAVSKSHIGHSVMTAVSG